jgi:hypothetical protein
MADRTKMADQNQIFRIILRVSNIFSVFFLHSFGITTQVFWKKVFQKIQDGGWNEKTRLSRHLGFFEKLFSKKLASYIVTPNECKKKTEKMLDTL